MKNSFLVTLFVIVTLKSSITMAKDLGVLGNTYPIAEADFYDYIQQKVKLFQNSNKWQTLQNSMQNTAVSYRNRPTKVVGITRAIESKIWMFDPSIVLDHDVTDSNNKLIARAGTVVNPLLSISLSKALLFFNGDDEEQVNWAIKKEKEQKGHVKFILVDGSPQQVEKALKKIIYFDQSGVLTARFNIKHVPAIVTQQGIKLQIQEEKI